MLPYVAELSQLLLRLSSVHLGVSPNRGNQDINVVPGLDHPVQYFSTALTAARTVKLFNPSPGTINGSLMFRFVRPASGAFNLNVNDANSVLIKALAASTWCDIMWNGSSWTLIASGSL